MTATLVDVEHGTRQGYRSGCKCAECRKANAAATALSRRSPSCRVSAGKVRSYIEELQQCGLSLREIGRRAGVSRETVRAIATSESPRCRSDTRNRILGVLPARQASYKSVVSRTTLNVFERFYSYVEFTDGCWYWRGSTSKTGYGTFTLRPGKPGNVHRIAYTWAFGEIPPGLEIDHLCRVRCCVNPAHLEVVTHAENIRRIQRVQRPEVPPPADDFLPDDDPPARPTFEDPLASLRLLLTSAEDLAWKDDAECARLEIPVERRQQWFFPMRGESPIEAKSVCSRCPVWASCLEFALDWNMEGIWGRSAGSDRRKLVRHEITIDELLAVGMGEDRVPIGDAIGRVLDAREAVA